MTLVHVVTCLLLILTVLLQTGKGADIGAVFGGSSSTVFGSSGAGNFLTKLTTALAVIFMLTSLLLTYGSIPKPSKTIFDNPTAIPETPPQGSSAAQAGQALPEAVKVSPPAPSEKKDSP